MQSILHTYFNTIRTNLGWLLYKSLEDWVSHCDFTCSLHWCTVLGIFWIRDMLSAMVCSYMYKETVFFRSYQACRMNLHTIMVAYMCTNYFVQSLQDGSLSKLSIFYSFMVTLDINCVYVSFLLFTMVLSIWHIAEGRSGIWYIIKRFDIHQNFGTRTSNPAVDASQDQ